MILLNVVTLWERASSGFIDLYTGAKHDLGFRLFEDNMVCYEAGERPLLPLRSERMLVVMADRIPSQDHMPCEEKHTWV